MTPAGESTKVAADSGAGGRRHVDRLFELVYADLHRVAQRYADGFHFGHEIQPTQLLHDAFLKLAHHDQVDWRGKSHFMAVGAAAMRSILVDLARKKQSRKHGGGYRRVAIDEAVAISITKMEDVLAIEEALAKLETLSQRQAKLVEMRYFGGLTVAEAAESLGVSKRYAEQQWTFAKAWLRRELSKDGGH